MTENGATETCKTAHHPAEVHFQVTSSSKANHERKYLKNHMYNDIAFIHPAFIISTTSQRQFPSTATPKLSKKFEPTYTKKTYPKKT